jgi:hypothetical protein
VYQLGESSIFDYFFTVSEPQCPFVRVNARIPRFPARRMGYHSIISRRSQYKNPPADPFSPVVFVLFPLDYFLYSPCFFFRLKICHFVEFSQDSRFFPFLFWKLLKICEPVFSHISAFFDFPPRFFFFAVI